MNSKSNDNLTSKEKNLREKARQSLKKNITPAYSSEDEGGIMSGPTTKDEMERQAKKDDQ